MTPKDREKAMAAVQDDEAWWRSVTEWDWVVVNASDYLHAPGESITLVDEVIADGSTVCGIAGEMAIPGLFTRMGSARCPACCDAVGMPHGKGSPKNDAGCRAIAEKRTAQGHGG